MPRSIEQILQDAEDLRNSFRIWQSRADFWLSHAFPGGPGAQIMSKTGTIYQTEAVQSVLDQRSRFVGEWIGRRGNALLNRRTAAKTKINSAAYGETDDSKAGDEKLVELGRDIFTRLDRQTVRGMGGTSWDANLKTQGTWLGKQAFSVRLYDGGERGLQVDAQFIDPYNLYHDIDVGPQEELRLVREFRVKWADLPGLYQQWGAGREGQVEAPSKPQDGPDELATCMDYWRRDPDGHIWHSIFTMSEKDSQGHRHAYPVRASGEWDDHGYKGTFPIVVVANRAANHGFQDIRLGSMTATDAKVYYHAEPFYARAINLLVFLQALEGLAADGDALASLPIFLHKKGDNGGSTDKKDIKPFGFIEMATDEQLTILQNIASGQTKIGEAIGRMNDQLNEVYPRHLVSPDFPAGSSGYAINSQISQASMYMVPWTRMDEACKEQLLMSVIDQHVNIFPEKAFYLSGIMPDGRKYSHAFGVKDYPQSEFEIDVQEPAEIPGEILQKANLALQLTQGELPVSSMWRARIDLGIGEPHREQERIDDERYKASAEYQNWQKLVRFGKQVDEQREAAAKTKKGTAEWWTQNLALKQAENYLSSLQMQLGGAPQTGFQMPKEPGNPPNTALPPQATTEDPNMKALAAGAPPTGTGGRPRPEGTK